MAEAAVKPNTGAGLRGQSAGQTAISTVGATGNNLRYRGFNVQDLAAGRLLALDLSQLTPGRYRLELEITTATGEHCSGSSCEFEGVAGPEMPGGGF